MKKGKFINKNELMSLNYWVKQVCAIYEEDEKNVEKFYEEVINNQIDINSKIKCFVDLFKDRKQFLQNRGITFGEKKVKYVRIECSFAGRPLRRAMEEKIKDELSDKTRG